MYKGALVRGRGHWPVNPFPSFPGQEGLGVEFLGPGEDKVFGCGVPNLYHGQRMRPEKLAVI